MGIGFVLPEEMAWELASSCPGDGSRAGGGQGVSLPIGFVSAGRALPSILGIGFVLSGRALPCVWNPIGLAFLDLSGG